MYTYRANGMRDEIKHMVKTRLDELNNVLLEVEKHNYNSLFLPMMGSLEIAENIIMELRRWLLEQEESKEYTGRREEDYTIVIKINPYNLKLLSKDEIDKAIANGTIKDVIQKAITQ